jgi:lipopolysaccharide/colanic/teichoic acid biosynthesis glycosyltransferase
MLKRAFDIVAAAAGLILLWPLLLAVAAAVKLSSPGPVLFRQERIGKAFRPFFIYKFRSMVPDAPQRGGPITFGDDSRITPLGRLLRKTKLDELPQLINVLKGDMSFVGPRPEVRKYVELFRGDYEEILRVRPGITDLASLRYRDEAVILGQAENPADEYASRVLPEKIALAKQYVARSSFLLDVSILLKTFCGLFYGRA